jgi:hypothetical protein
MAIGINAAGLQDKPRRYREKAIVYLRFRGALK